MDNNNFFKNLTDESTNHYDNRPNANGRNYWGSQYDDYKNPEQKLKKKNKKLKQQNKSLRKKNGCLENERAASQQQPPIDPMTQMMQLVQLMQAIQTLAQNGNPQQSSAMSQNQNKYVAFQGGE